MKAPSTPLAAAILAVAFSSGLALAQNSALNVVSVEATGPVTSEPGPLILVAPGEFTIRRKGDLAESLVISLATRGTATPRLDYAPLPERVEFRPGADSLTLRVLGIDDDVVEEPETVVLTILPASATLRLYAIDPDAGSATVTINDTDRQSIRPTVSIEATVAETTEPSPTIRVIPGEFTLRRRGDLRANDLSEPLTVFLSYTGTATSEADYTKLPERVEFAAGQDTATLKVFAVDDDEVEDDEIVIATLFDPTLGPLPRFEIDPNHGAARVVIHDSDRPSELSTVCIKATGRIAEETAAPLRRLNLVGEFTVSRRGPTEHSQSVWLHVAGSAIPRADYEPLPILVTIPAGESSIALPVTAVFDEIPEGIETVIATLSPCPPFGSLAPCFAVEVDPACESATVFIREDGLSVASVHLTSPSSGDQFATGEPITLKAVAIHLESFLTHVTFCADGEKIGESEIAFVRAPDPGTPVTHTFVWERAPAGRHVLTAKALRPTQDPNTRPETIVSSPVRITVGDLPPSRDPAGAIVSPAAGDHFLAGEPITIAVQASDPDGYLTRVEFFADGLKIGEQNINYFAEPPAGEPITLSFVWEHALPGPHVLRARVTDNSGASAPTEPVQITVGLRDLLPIVNVVARDALAVEPGPDRTANPATFRIRRHGSAQGELTVHYSLLGQARNGVDYEELSGLAIIPDDSDGVDVTVTPLADREEEGAESVILRLTEDPAYRLGDLPRASAVIHDQPMPEPPHPPRCLRLEDGLIHICFPAQPGVCFRIESSSNLRDWSTLFCLLPVDGTIHFIDERNPAIPRRYFRIAPEPNGLPGE